ncbi:MAG: FAD-binding oxidoreductase [Hyphomonadaceae bacterium]|nr:FAD-binding oxidoreductase [Hyphomonadaceae bacterium]
MKRVVIIGAGIIGLMCGVRLAKAGARVTVLEAEGDNLSVFSAMASAAAAGMLAPLSGADSVHARIALDSFDLWRAWSPGAAWADGVRFEGAVVLHETGPEAQAHLARVQQAGRAAAALNAGQVRRRAGLAPRTDAALFIEDEGVADPIRVLSGLAMEARAHGVSLRYDADARIIAANVVVTHAGERHEADAIVLAPGAWAHEALVNAAPALKHVGGVKGHVAAVQLERALHPNIHAAGFYLAERREDVVLGASMEPGVYTRNVAPEQVAALFAAAEAVLPGQVKPTGRAWAGIRPMSPDGWPLIGPAGPGVLVAAGHSREGWLLAPITAEIISAYVFESAISPAWAALSPARFES